MHLLRENKARHVIDIIEEYEKVLGRGLTEFSENLRAIIIDSLPMSLYPCMNEGDDCKSKECSFIHELYIIHNFSIMMKILTIQYKTEGNLFLLSFFNSIKNSSRKIISSIYKTCCTS